MTLSVSISGNNGDFCLAESPLAALLLHYVKFIHDKLRTKTVQSGPGATF